jgi:ketosteroid isomerase-like protein
MSQENVEFLRGAFEEWHESGGSFETIPVDLYAEDVEWDLSAYPLVDFETRGRGRDGLFRNWGVYFSGWRDYRSEVKEMLDAGDDKVVVVLVENVRVSDSDTLIQRDVFQLWTLRNRQVVKWQVFETRDQALEAAGVGEATAS